jgi:lipopolysaccharide export system protein LptA
MTGKLITYENLTDVFTIDGQRTADGTKSTSGRVRATLAPRTTMGDKK